MLSKIQTFLESAFSPNHNNTDRMESINDELITGEVRRLDDGKGFSTTEMDKISLVFEEAVNVDTPVAPRSTVRLLGSSPGTGLSGLLIDESISKSSSAPKGITINDANISTLFSPSPPARGSHHQITQRVVSTSAGSIVLVAHEQVIIKIVASYYANLQPIGYSLKGLHLIHSVTKLGKTNISADMTLMIDSLKQAQLFEVTTILAKLLLPTETQGSFELLDNIHPSDVFNVLDELMIEYVDAHTVYIAIANLAEGGKEYIQPFIPFNIFGKELWDEIENLCSTGDSLDSIAAPIDPRSVSEKSVGFINRVVSFNPSSSQLTDTIRESHQPVMEEIVDVADLAVQQRNLQKTPVTEETGATLLEDGRPRGPPIVRNTVEFREGAANNAAVVQRMVSLEGEVALLNGISQEIMRMVKELTTKVTRMDESLNCLIIQHSQSDLARITTVNQGLLNPENTSGIVSLSTPRVALTEGSSKVKSISYMISLLSKDAPDKEALNEVIPHMKEVLKNAGRHELASALCLATFNLENNRKRLITQLKGLH